MSDPTPHDLLRRQFAYAMSPEAYQPGDFTTAYDDVIDRALSLAIAAALSTTPAQPHGFIACPEGGCPLPANHAAAPSLTPRAICVEAAISRQAMTPDHALPDNWIDERLSDPMWHEGWYYGYDAARCDQAALLALAEKLRESKP